MIISFIQTKGGTAKTTLAKCISFSKTFRKEYESIALVEFDPQGTIESWSIERQNNGLQNKNVSVVSLAKSNKNEVEKTLSDLMDKTDAIILDVPGESTGKFATRFSLDISDLVFIPMRSSTNDEQSFIDNMYPLINQAVREEKGRAESYFIIPTFVHPATRIENIEEYFNEIMPYPVVCLDNALRQRSVFENFDRNGFSLDEYAEEVKSNQKLYEQANKAINDIEKLAKSILRKVR